MKDISRKSNDRVQEIIINITTIMLIIAAVVLVLANFSTTAGDEHTAEEMIDGENDESRYSAVETGYNDETVQKDNPGPVVGETVANSSNLHGNSIYEMYDNGLNGELMSTGNTNNKYNNVAAGKLNRTQEVDEDYFDNTIFIGDSRTVAMQVLGLIDAEDTFAVDGINHVDYMSNVFYDEVTGINGTIFEIVEKRRPDKIYVALGVNGVAFMQKAVFLEKYIEMIERLMEAAPNSKIIIESILPVNEETYSRGNPNMNNVNIDDMNRELLNLVNIKEIYYLDISNVLKDENNRLADKYDCGDGIHFTNAGYEAVYYEMCHYGVD